MSSIPKSFVFLLLILACAGVRERAGAQDDRIDMRRAKELLQLQRRGETLSAEDQAYLDRAKAIRAERRAREPGSGARRRDGGARNPGAGRPSTGILPLCCMKAGDQYEGEDGGLYGGGRNTPPDSLKATMAKQLAGVRPLDREGEPAEDGKIVLLSIGMSNTTQEFSAFKRSIEGDPRKSPRVVLVDGAQGGQSATEWTVRNAERTWSRLDARLVAAGVSPEQVQALWVKQAELNPLPDAMKNGRMLQEHLVEILNRARARFPNLRLAYLSSRTYGGYSGRHPEPESFATAFSVRWVILDQMAGKPELNWDPAVGEVKAPLVLWGPYFWADGITPRPSDGLVWNREDFIADGTHPSESGKVKVVRMLTDFFTTNPAASGWFRK